MGSAVIEVDDEAVEGHLEKIKAEAGDKLVVVDFIADWCPECMDIKPVFHKVAEKMTEAQVVFVSCDVDENDDTAMALELTALPSFHFYKGGKLLKAHHPWNEILMLARSKDTAAVEELLQKEIELYASS